MGGLRVVEARGAHARRRVLPSRLAVVYDVDGPRVRLGILWFFLNLVAFIVGAAAVAVLYGLTAGVAALQTARAWRSSHRMHRPHRGVAGGGAVLLPLAAYAHTALLGATLLVLAGAATYVAVVDTDPTRKALGDAGDTLWFALPVGVAAACLVLTYRDGLGAAVALLLVVSAYETGDYLMGSRGLWKLEGPIAGASAIFVVMLAVGVLRLPPFAPPQAFWFAGLGALWCPVGQLVASAVLTRADAFAPALRRLDSLLVLAPLWTWFVGIPAN